MQMMTSRWTDDRMDDLKHEVDELGRRMDAGFAEARRELSVRLDRMEARLDERFDKVDERFDKVDERFERVDEKFERVGEQLMLTQDRILGVHAAITRFSLAFVVVLFGLVVTRLA